MAEKFFLLFSTKKIIPGHSVSNKKRETFIALRGAVHPIL